MSAGNKLLQAAAGGGEGADADFESTVLLLNADDASNGGQNNTFLDSSSNTYTITRNGNTTQGSFSPFSVDDGKWGNYFDGSGDYLTGTWDVIGTNQFTCEAWVYITEGSNRKQIVGPGTNTATHYDGFGFEVQGQTLNMWASSDGTSWNLVTSDTSQGRSANSVPLNAWTHIAMTRDSSGVFRSFINGKLECVVSPGTAALADSGSTVLNIGRSRFNGDFANYLGYMSNLRIVNGSVVSAYSTASTSVGAQIFTPPTAPLTAITNTSLLTCQSNRFVDNSSNAYTLTPAGNTKVVPFSPFPQTTAYDASTNGGSGYLDGSDYIQTPTDAALSSTLLASDFTIQCWVYLTTLTNGAPFWTNSTSNSDSFTSSYVYSTGSVGTGKVGTNEFTSATGVVRAGEWTHFACVRDGATVYMYVNGVQVASGAASTYLTTSTAKPMTFGRNFQTTPAGNIGYFSQIKVSDVAINFASAGVPAAPATDDSDTVLLLNFTNASIKDATGRNVLETVGNAQVDTTTKKYGTGSMEFDGSGDWLKIPNSPDIQLGTGDFTIEFWVYLATGDTGSARGLIAKGGASTGWLVSLDSSEKVVFTYTTSTITSSGAITTNAWNHIAVVREGTGSNETKIYIGGSNDGTGTVSTDFNQTEVMYIGANRAAGDPMKGFIDDLRITKGIARYTVNFTPRTKALPVIGE